MSILSTGLDVLSGAVGAYGAKKAASAQIAGGKNALRQQQLNSLYQNAIYEPYRNVGYQALGDLASAAGYSMPAYTSQSELNSLGKQLTAKQVKKLMKSGMSLDQISQLGTLANFSSKSIRMLKKAGLSNDQILSLTNRDAGSVSAAPTTPSAGSASGATDFTRFYDSPDYLFRQNQGMSNIQNSAAARGGVMSGNALKALNEYNSNLAANEFNNWWNRRFQLSGMGQNATNSLSGASQNSTNAISGIQQGIGDARASGILGMTNSITGAIGSIAGGIGSYSPSSLGTGSYGYSSYNPSNSMTTYTPFGSGSWDYLNASGG